MRRIAFGTSGIMRRPSAFPATQKRRLPNDGRRRFRICLSADEPTGSLHETLFDHAVGHLAEAGDVAAHHVVAGLAEFFGGIVGSLEDAGHDALELAVHFVEGPGSISSWLVATPPALAHLAGP